MSDSALRVEAVTKGYRMGQRLLEVLEDVSFSLTRGELLAITGHSGSGKTTLLHILGTLDRPDSGEVHYGETNLGDLAGQRLERFRNAEIGFVFQFFQLLPEFSALENVMMPMLIAGENGSRARSKAEEILGEVGLEDRLEHYPSQLSGGEQQRAAIARALVRSPRLLLADEPTGNLDTATGNRVFSLLRTLQKERGLSGIIVTHNMENARQCDRIIALEELNQRQAGPI